MFAAQKRSESPIRILMDLRYLPKIFLKNTPAQIHAKLHIGPVNGKMRPHNKIGKKSLL